MIGAPDISLRACIFARLMNLFVSKPSLAPDEEVVLRRTPTSCGDLWGVLYITSRRVCLVPGPIARLRRRGETREWQYQDVVSFGRISGPPIITWDGSLTKIGLTMRSGEVITFRERIPAVRALLLPQLRALFPTATEPPAKPRTDGDGHAPS